MGLGLIHCDSGVDFAWWIVLLDAALSPSLASGTKRLSVRSMQTRMNFTSFLFFEAMLHEK